jgi:formylglycine-generating enzyme required for sulfatase activity
VVRTTNGAADVDTFFLSPHEVTREQWLPFLVTLHRAWSGTAAQPADQRLQLLAAELGVKVPDARVVEALLSRRTALQDDSKDRAGEPIDEISQYGAAMFAHWQKRSLPNLAEWTMAALGPAASSRKYPWGDEWTNDQKIRNIGKRLQRADQGGQTSSDRRLAAVRHLVGNAAEWLEAEEGALEGALAGGSCTDTMADLKDAAGGRPRVERRSTIQIGNGLRTILRPQSFFGETWPANP